MSLPRIYYSERLSLGDTFVLAPFKTHHLIDVLRIKSGAEVVLFNGDGYEYEAKLIISHKREATVTLLNSKKVFTESKLTLHLGQAICSSDRMDFSIQKATELGVSSITPLTTAFCQVPLSQERSQKKKVRWRNIAIHATEQCGRVQVPVIEGPGSFMEWISLPHEGVKLIAHHKGTYPFPKQEEAPKQCVILIGPEGGFSEEEVTFAKQQGFHPISFGPRILRTETATVVALTLIQSLWGDIAP